MNYLDIQYDTREYCEEDYILVFQNNKLLLKENSQLLQGKDIQGEAYFLFTYEAKRYYLAMEATILCPYCEVEVRHIRHMFSHDQALMLGVGVQLRNFYTNTKYCSRCGNKLVRATNERAMICTCGYRMYPPVMPAVITMIIDRERNKVLLTRSHQMNKDAFGLVAGFLEVGETFEEGVRREIQEEVQLNIKKLTYYGNQPWGYGNNIMIAFYCELDGDPTITLQEEELSEAWWADIDTLQLEKNKVSIAHKMLYDLKQKKL